MNKSRQPSLKFVIHNKTQIFIHFFLFFALLKEKAINISFANFTKIEFPGRFLPVRLATQEISLEICIVVHSLFPHFHSSTEWQSKTTGERSGAGPTYIMYVPFEAEAVIFISITHKTFEKAFVP